LSIHVERTTNQPNNKPTNKPNKPTNQPNKPTKQPASKAGRTMQHNQMSIQEMADEAAADHPGLWEPLACHLVGLSDKKAFIQNMHDYLPLACPVLMASRFDEHAAKYGVHTKSAWEVVSDQTGKAVRVTTVLVGTDVRLSTLFRAQYSG